MSVDFTPDFADYTGVGAFKWWAQSVIPLVYDDSLSYYEVLCKVTDYLNKVITDLSATETNVDALRQAYDQLQGYVNDYFDNLDVQNEIDDKLDRMVVDGTIAGIVAPIAQAYSAPVFVDAVNKMTDPTKNYVLTTNGHIYIWNGSQRVDSGMVYDINGLTFIYRNTFTNRRYNIDSLTESGFYFYTNGINATGLDYTKFSIGFVCLYGDGTGNLKATINDVNGNMAFGNNEGTAGSWTWTYHLAVDDTLTVAGAPGDAKAIGDKLLKPHIDKYSLINFGYRTPILGNYTKDGTTYPWRLQSMCIVNDVAYIFLSQASNDGHSRMITTGLDFNIAGAMADPDNHVFDFMGGHCNDCDYDPVNNRIIIVSGELGADEETGQLLPGWIGEPLNVGCSYNLTSRSFEKIYITGVTVSHSISYINGYWFVHNSSMCEVLDANFNKVREFTASKRITADDIWGNRGVSNDYLFNQTSFTDGYDYYHVMTANFNYSGEGAYYWIITKFLFDGTHCGTSIIKTGINLESECACLYNNTLYFMTDGRFFSFGRASFIADNAYDISDWEFKGGEDLTVSNMPHMFSRSTVATKSLVNAPPKISGSFELFNLRHGSAGLWQLANAWNMPGIIFSRTILDNVAQSNWNAILPYGYYEDIVPGNYTDLTIDPENRGIVAKTTDHWGTVVCKSGLWFDTPTNNETWYVKNIPVDNGYWLQLAIVGNSTHLPKVAYRMCKNGVATTDWAMISNSLRDDILDANLLMSNSTSMLSTIENSPDGRRFFIYTLRVSTNYNIQFAVSTTAPNGSIYFRTLNKDGTTISIPWTKCGDICSHITFANSSYDIPITTATSNFGAFGISLMIAASGADSYYGEVKIYGTATSNNITNLVQNFTAPTLSPANITMRIINNNLQLLLRVENNTGNLTVNFNGANPFQY